MEAASVSKFIARYDLFNNFTIAAKAIFCYAAT
jgi:hypothetical protein